MPCTGRVGLVLNGKLDMLGKQTSTFIGVYIILLQIKFALKTVQNQLALFGSQLFKSKNRFALHE